MRIYDIIGDFIGIGVADFKTVHGSWIFWDQSQERLGFHHDLMGIKGGLMIFSFGNKDEKVRRIAHYSHYDLGLLPIFIGTWSLSILNMSRKYSVNSNSGWTSGWTSVQGDFFWSIFKIHPYGFLKSRGFHKSPCSFQY